MQLQVVFVNKTDENETVKKIFDVERYVEVDAKNEGDDVVFAVTLRTDKVYDDRFIFNTLQEYPFIKSITRIDDD